MGPVVKGSTSAGVLLSFGVMAQKLGSECPRAIQADYSAFGSSSCSNFVSNSLTFRFAVNS